MNKIIVSTKLAELGLQAMQQAARTAYEDHARTNDPVIMYDGEKVVEINPQSCLDRQPVVNQTITPRKAS